MMNEHLKYVKNKTKQNKQAKKTNKPKTTKIIKERNINKKQTTRWLKTKKKGQTLKKPFIPRLSIAYNYVSKYQMYSFLEPIENINGKEK